MNTSARFPVSLTAEQELLQDSLRQVLQELNPFEERRRRLAGRCPERMALWRPLAELGVAASLLDETHGGFDGSAATVAMVMAELGRALPVEPFLASALIAARLLAHADPAQDVLAGGIDGSCIAVLAHDAGDDPFAAPQLYARRDGGKLRLSGRMRAIRHADVAQVFLVPLLSEDGIGIWRVPADATELAISTFRTIDGAGAGDLVFEHLALDPTQQLELADPAAALADAVEWGLLGLTAETWGIADTLNRQTFDYLRTRHQFGQPLAAFQALQHRAADMFIAAEELAAALATAVTAFAAGPPSARRSAAACAAKAVADQAGRRIGNEAVQLHGAMGVSDELAVSHYFRRLAAIRHELGTADLHRLRYRSLSR